MIYLSGALRERPTCYRQWLRSLAYIQGAKEALLATPDYDATSYRRGKLMTCSLEYKLTIHVTNGAEIPSDRISSTRHNLLYHDTSLSVWRSYQTF